jgi:hypothetical protein
MEPSCSPTTTSRPSRIFSVTSSIHASSIEDTPRLSSSARRFRFGSMLASPAYDAAVASTASWMAAGRSGAELGSEVTRQTLLPHGLYAQFQVRSEGPPQNPPSLGVPTNPAQPGTDPSQRVW